MRKLSAILLLFLCASAAAEPREVAVEQGQGKHFALKNATVDPVPVGGFADLTVNIPKGASVIWRISPAPVQKANDLPPGRLIFGGVAGTTYTATAIVVDFEAKTVTDADYVIPFSGTPPPNPGPNPNPNPNPNPSALNAAYVIVVHDLANLTPAFAKVLGDTAYWDGLKARGISWRHYVTSSPDVAAKHYDKYAKEAGYPAVLFLDKTGKVLKSAKFASTSDIDSMLKGEK